jgi:hypothetical protein
MTAEEEVTTMTSLEVRERLVEALKLDLIGPWAGHALAEEQLPGHIRPSNWYLAGFLIPAGSPPDASSDPDEDEDLEEIPDDVGLPEESAEERRAAKKAYFPSSMGLSFLVSSKTDEFRVSVTWGDYTTEPLEGPDEGERFVWQRHPREAALSIPIPEREAEVPVPDADGLVLHVSARVVSSAVLAGHIPAGARAVSVFLVNRRAPDEAKPDLAYIFQPEISVTSKMPLVPRPDPHGAEAADWDEQVADLQYADTPEYAVGHGVAAAWELVDGACHTVRTAWIPSAEVEYTETTDPEGVELSMIVLGDLTGGDSNGNSVRKALEPLVTRYRNWIDEQRSVLESLSGVRRETAEQLLGEAESTARRIEQGIDTLSSDPEALDAFRVANRAVARALQQRVLQRGECLDDPRWRAFQLAFILLNVPGIADPIEPTREKMVDLLFFPTGGGKTEAYLGLAAFAMVLRRLRNPGQSGRQGAGVTVIMRYTLRLLTLDQLSRAAGLVCALELERSEDPERYGEWPFEIGLWVGKAATPNIMGRKGDGRSDTARIKTNQFKSDPNHRPSPIPLENCPWCGTRFGADSFLLCDDQGRPDTDNPMQLRVRCTNIECDFTRDRALPIVAVDEPLYRRLPAFLIATVDKFASLPWVGPSGALLGGADRFDSSGFYGPAEPGKGSRLPAPLLPPDLIIQDELHLISGPLGTMTGLYETAIEALCSREIDGKTIKPKIVASTATARRAQDQVQALFGRALTQIFPPQGPDRRDSFFAHTRPSTDVSARLYLGVAAQGRNPKVAMRKTYLALMGAAQRAYLEAGGWENKENPADPYMTVMGYFNSLRELGGARRILEEEVQNTLKEYGQRRRIGEKTGLFRDRTIHKDVVELTSRVSTDKVAEARRRLESGYFDRDQRVDYAIATNMISVGIDVPRLGLMVVVGQPKAHAEYIQATSRVGRDPKRPGLVVTLFNVHKPRDRSHYERFRHYHETFYRSVEVGSVTPFAARALDRGFPGALVALARHVERSMTPPLGAESIASERGRLEKLLLEMFRDRVLNQPCADEAEREQRLRSVQNRVVDLLDSWRKVFEDYAAVGACLQYQKYEKDGPKPLLRDLLDEDFETPHHRKFRVGRSLRDVEPEVNLMVESLTASHAEERS